MREKNGNAPYIVRQLYQKHLLGYEERCNKRGGSYKRPSPAAASNNLSSFERIVAAANGKEDIEVLGAVAALMDVPTTENAARKRRKLDPAEARLSHSTLSVS